MEPEHIILGVGQFNSITHDRQWAKVRNVIVGDLDRIKYLCEKLYINILLVNYVIIDDMELLLQMFSEKTLLNFMRFFANRVIKVYFSSKELTGTFKSRL